MHLTQDLTIKNNLRFPAHLDDWKVCYFDQDFGATYARSCVYACVYAYVHVCSVCMCMCVYVVCAALYALISASCSHCYFDQDLGASYV
jgi:hypothetical protein